MLNLAAHCSCLGMGGQEKYRPMRAEPWTLPQLMVSPATTLGAMFCYWVCLFLDMLPLWHLAPLLCFLYLAKGDTEGFSFSKRKRGCCQSLYCVVHCHEPHIAPQAPQDTPWWICCSPSSNGCHGSTGQQASQADSFMLWNIHNFSNTSSVAIVKLLRICLDWDMLQMQIIYTDSTCICRHK